MRAIEASDWTSIETLPESEGEYLCWVRVNRQHHGLKGARVSYSRYMALEFADGGFWINGGMPQGMVTHWIKLVTPNG